MTGGRVVVLGRAGRNFAAGMSGGVAYVLDEAGDFASRCNLELVGLSRMDDPEELALVRAMIEKHVRWTESAYAVRLLERWPDTVRKLVRVLPNDYRRMIEAMARMRAKGLAQEEAELAAFEENARDLARAGGN
jgi:glutamate synthase (ferredoxin)